MNRLLPVVFVLLGCGAGTSYTKYDFARDAEKTTNVGSPMVTWLYHGESFGAPIVNTEHTLTYSGREGPIIRIVYREAMEVDRRGGMMARPAFTQELVYDLTTSPTISFRDIRIDVLEATSSSIRFAVRDSLLFASPSWSADRDPVPPQKLRVEDLEGRGAFF